MSRLTRSKPSFVIYRDEPEVISSSSKRDTPTVMTHHNNTSSNTFTSTRQALSISTSFSFNDKENSAPYPTSAPGGKQAKSVTKLTTKSAPTSPLMNSAQASASSIRLALATKFVAPSKTRSSSNTTKSKSQSSTLKRSASTQNASATMIGPGSSPMEKPKLRVKRSASSSSVSGRKHSSRSTTVASLANITETVEEVVGPDGLTAADRRAIELTQLPLADISAAFSTAAVAPGGDVPTLSRKRSRDLAVASEAEEPLSSQEINSSPQRPTLNLSQQETDLSSEALSCPSPSKRCRLSPVDEAAPQLPLPLSSQPTLIEEFFEVPNYEATLVDL
ncbi:hypothetical protein FRB94_008252 [Tulasnella sp. JGI-2019a]|nr:hypothetical protein FRB94_008252 [Tulasnella sp. JGI-2019a]